MAVTKTILGMNARNFLYIRKYNSTRAKRIADDKLETKQVLTDYELPTPKLIVAFYHQNDIKEFDWNLPADGFVIKPARGYGGGGILVIRHWNNTEKIATTVNGDTYTIKQLESHILDIFDGAYSLQFLPDKAYIEERVTPHPFFRRLDPIGIPDIRVIVFNKVPIMAMMRLPTKESKGKANLHLGALGIGIDIRTGITTHALRQGKLVSLIPGTKIKTSGIKIPFWNELLLLASRTQDASELGYAGVDMVIDAALGPLVLEINARPGLSIQTANLKSLRTRLERVEDMKIMTPERGVEVASSLFAEHFSERVNTGPKILTVIQPVILQGAKQQDGALVIREVEAKLDTGALRTSLDINLAKELGLVSANEQILVKSASGQHYRDTVHITFELGGKTIKTIASTVDRSAMKFPMIIGRRDLKDFLIRPIYGPEPTEQKDQVEELDR